MGKPRYLLLMRHFRKSDMGATLVDVADALSKYIKETSSLCDVKLTLGYYFCPGHGEAKDTAERLICRLPRGANEETINLLTLKGFDL
jgi:hypothetical protein